MKKTVRIGTRKSLLALVQTEIVKKCAASCFSGDGDRDREDRHEGRPAPGPLSRCLWRQGGVHGGAGGRAVIRRY